MVFKMATIYCFHSCRSICCSHPEVDSLAPPLESHCLCLALTIEASALLCRLSEDKQLSLFPLRSQTPWKWCDHNFIPVTELEKMPDRTKLRSVLTNN